MNYIANTSLQHYKNRGHNTNEMHILFSFSYFSFICQSASHSRWFITVVLRFKKSMNNSLSGHSFQQSSKLCGQSNMIRYHWNETSRSGTLSTE